MSQRVYLVAVDPEFIGDLVTFLGAPSEVEEDAWNGLRLHAERHARVHIPARWLANGLDESAFRQASRQEDFACIGFLRPYPIVATGAAQGAAHVARLLDASSEDVVLSQLEPGLRSLGELWKPPAKETLAAVREAYDAEWASVRAGFDLLKSWRRSFDQGQEVTEEVPVTRPVEDFPGAFIVEDRTTVRTVPVEEIPSRFGSRLSHWFGRAAGLCGPSWWLGRNYWPGRLAGTSLGPDQEPNDLQRLILSAGGNPAGCFEEVAPAGYTDAFDCGCSAWQTGLLFPTEGCAQLLSSFQADRSCWTELGRRVTGYSEADLAALENSLEEALIFAVQSGTWLLEGDELVGSLGDR